MKTARGQKFSKSVPLDYQRDISAAEKKMKQKELNPCVIPFTACIFAQHLGTTPRKRRRLAPKNAEPFEVCKNYGLVVQLVRMPPCHGGGRGFESRPDRKAAPVLGGGFLRLGLGLLGWWGGFTLGDLDCSAVRLQDTLPHIHPEVGGPRVGDQRTAPQSPGWHATAHASQDRWTPGWRPADCSAVARLARYRMNIARWKLPRKHPEVGGAWVTGAWTAP